ncbi:MAG TPA: phosphoribosyltransferase family protein [Polyangia bacterium]|nr:phosphoribosyltransferase family protein [Polyangia bacterium]
MAPRREVSWQEYGELCKRLAIDIQARGPFDALVGIARGGSIVGATLSFMLNLEYFPIRLGKRGGVTRVIVPPPPELAGRSVVLVDDLSRTGDTFKIALHELRRVGVTSTLTVALVRREPGYRPDIAALTASAVDKVAFPWGREELVNGKFELRKL